MNERCSECELEEGHLGDCLVPYRARIEQAERERDYWKKEYADQMIRPCHVIHHEDQEIRLEQAERALAATKHEHTVDCTGELIVTREQRDTARRALAEAQEQLVIEGEAHEACIGALHTTALGAIKAEDELKAARRALAEKERQHADQLAALKATWEAKDRALAEAHAALAWAWQYGEEHLRPWSAWSERGDAHGFHCWGCDGEFVSERRTGWIKPADETFPHEPGCGYVQMRSALTPPASGAQE